MIGEVLVTEGYLTPDQLESALQRQKQMPGVRLGQVLIGMGLLQEDHIAWALAKKFGLPFTYLDSRRLDAGLASALGAESCVRVCAVPVEDHGAVLSVAIADPTNRNAMVDMAAALGKPVEWLVATPTEIGAAIKRLHGIADGDAVEGAASVSAPMVETLLEGALKSGATNLHLEPKEQHALVRLRIDGHMSTMFPVDVSTYRMLMETLKSAASLDVGEERVPQAGVIHCELNGRVVEIGLSVAPVGAGERAVLRFLGLTDPPPLRDFMDPDSGADLAMAVQATSGLVLFAGPVRSGTTTTLHATLAAIADGTRSVVAIEDSVDHVAADAVLMRIREDLGFTYEAALRTALEHDPDVIVLGCLSDALAMRAAISAGLYGHLVLATVQAPDAASALAMAVSAGGDWRPTRDAVSLVVSQRLLRRVCGSCTEPSEPPQLMADYYGLHLPESTSWATGAGCHVCSGSGYAGRVPVFETLVVRDRVATAARAGATGEELFAAAVADGMRPMWEGAVQLAARGVTTFEEIARSLHGIRIPSSLKSGPAGEPLPHPMTAPGEVSGVGGVYGSDVLAEVAALLPQAGRAVAAGATTDPAASLG